MLLLRIFSCARRFEPLKGGGHGFYRKNSSLILFLGLSSVWRYFLGFSLRNQCPKLISDSYHACRVLFIILPPFIPWMLNNFSGGFCLNYRCDGEESLQEEEELEELHVTSIAATPLMRTMVSISRMISAA